jgi:hypothetical protein
VTLGPSLGSMAYQLGKGSDHDHDEEYLDLPHGRGDAESFHDVCGERRSAKQS